MYESITTKKNYDFASDIGNGMHLMLQQNCHVFVMESKI